MERMVIRSTTFLTSIYNHNGNIQKVFFDRDSEREFIRYLITLNIMQLHVVVLTSI